MGGKPRLLTSQWLPVPIRFAHNRAVSVVHPTAPAFRHLVHRLSDPEQFGIAVSGAKLTADFLAPQKVPTRVEQFQSSGWALDFHEAHVKARVFGPLPPGWASLGLMRSPAASSWYGYAARPGMLVCNPPGEPIDGCITPGFACMAVNVPVAVWERCRALAGIGRSAFGSVAAFHLPPLLYARIERRLRATRRRHRRAGPVDRLPAMALPHPWPRRPARAHHQSLPKAHAPTG